MQLAPIAPILASSPAIAPSPATSQGNLAPFGPVMPSPAPVTAPAAIEGATDGATFIDFPGLEAGNTFDVVKGSKVGIIGVRGDADIVRLDDEHATFHVKGGRLGVKVDVQVDIERTGPETVKISCTGHGIPDMTAEGKVVSNRTNYVEFTRIDALEESNTVISRDDQGIITIDTPLPRFGSGHLILKPNDQ